MNARRLTGSSSGTVALTDHTSERSKHAATRRPWSRVIPPIAPERESARAACRSESEYDASSTARTQARPHQVAARVVLRRGGMRENVTADVDGAVTAVFAG